MDEARTVLRRLERIEALRARKASPPELLEELRALLREGECWTAVEGDAAAGASAALGEIGAKLAGGPRIDDAAREVAAGRAGL